MVLAGNMRGVLFDLDGTVLDTFDLIASSFHHCMVDVLGQDRSMDRFNRRLGEPLREQLGEYAESEDQLEALLASYREHNAQAQYTHLKHFPGMPGVLEQLVADGWKLGIATSKLHRTAQENLNIMGLGQMFSCLVGADDVERPKPDGQSIEVAAQRLGLNPRECFYVGDSPYDIVAGNAAGATTVAVHWGQHPIQNLRPTQPALECVAPDELPGLVGQWSC